MRSDGEDVYIDKSSNNQGNSLLAALRNIVIIGILFLPSVIVGYAIFSLLRWFRLRPYIVSVISLFVVVVLIGLWWGLDYNQQLVDYFTGGWAGLRDNWTDLLPSVLTVYAIIGVAFGWFSAMFKARDMRKRPELLEFSGYWMYQFTYRKTPFEIYRRNKKVRGLKDGSFREDDRAPLGVDEEDDTLVSRYDAEAVQHLLITGGTGSGKTISMLSLIKNDIRSSKPVFVVDLKRSPDLASKLAKWTHDYGGEFYHFVNGAPETYDIPYSPCQSYYDPLKSGSNTSKQDMILSMREYDANSAVYKSNMQRLLSVIFNFTTVVRKLRESEYEKYGRNTICNDIDWDRGGMHMLFSASKMENFKQLLNTCADLNNPKISPIAQEVLNEIGGKHKSMLVHSLGELQGQLQIIIASEYGDWMQSVQGGRNIGLYDASVTPGSVVLFSLNSDDEKEFARFVGSIIMSDITRVSAERRNKDDSNLVNIYIDEFQILVPDSVTDLLEKSRASAMGVTLAQQSLSQVMKSAAGDGSAYLESILDTCSSFIFHAGAGYDTAERMAKIVGEHDVEVYSTNKRQNRYFFSFNFREDREGLTNTKLERRWIVEPSRFQNLSSPTKSNNYKSTAIIIKKASADPRYKNQTGSKVRETWMIPEDEVLEKVYEPSNSETRRIYDERHSEVRDDADYGSLDGLDALGGMQLTDDDVDGVVSDGDMEYQQDTGGRRRDEGASHAVQEDPFSDDYSEHSELDEDEEDWSLEHLEEIAESGEMEEGFSPVREEAPQRREVERKTVQRPPQRTQQRSQQNTPQRAQRTQQNTSQRAQRPQQRTDREQEPDEMQSGEMESDEMQYEEQEPQPPTRRKRLESIPLPDL